MALGLGFSNWNSSEKGHFRFTPLPHFQFRHDWIFVIEYHPGNFARSKARSRRARTYQRVPRHHRRLKALLRVETSLATANSTSRIIRKYCSKRLRENRLDADGFQVLLYRNRKQQSGGDSVLPSLHGLLQRFSSARRPLKSASQRESGTDRPALRTVSSAGSTVLYRK